MAAGSGAGPPSPNSIEPLFLQSAGAGPFYIIAPTNSEQSKRPVQTPLPKHLRTLSVAKSYNLQYWISIEGIH